MPDARTLLIADVAALSREIAASYDALRAARGRLDRDPSGVVLLILDPVDPLGRDLAQAIGATPTQITIGVIERETAASVFADEQINAALAAEVDADRVRVMCVAHGGVMVVDSRLDRSPDRVLCTLTTSWRSRFLEPQNLMRLGAEMLPHTLARTDDPLQAARLWMEHVEELARTDPHQAEPWREWQREGLAFGVLLWSARWASNGFPQVLLTPKLAASLMATSVGPENAELLELPWPAFLIQVPDGLLSGLDLSSRMPKPLDLVLIDTGAEGMHIMLGSRHHDLALHHPARSLAELAQDDVLTDPSRKEPAFIELEDHDQRALLLAGRLVVGIVLELGSEGHLERRSKGPRDRGPRRSLPKAWTFELRRDVRLDLRGSVRQFIQGHRGASPKVQTLVRGHWKRQPHGPASQLRKLVHVEPYWRGPEDAPIGVRAHRTRDL